MLRRALAPGIVLVSALGLTGCGGSPEPSRTVVETVTRTAQPSASATPSAAAPTTTGAPPTSVLPTTSGEPASGIAANPAPVAGDLRSDFVALEARLSGPAGIALVPVHTPGGGATAVTAGTLTTDVAWSTIKVPLAIAALRARPDAAAQALARRAITASDNDAAEALWSSLGGGEQAASQVSRVLAESGDMRTQVQSQHTRAGFSAFGQTRWALADAAAFAATLPCRPDAAPVLDLMGQVVPGQRWGLGGWDDARVKGGWGPSARGYLVRQLAVVSTPRGRVGVALAVDSPGGLAGGSADLDTIAAWLRQHATTLPGGHC